MATLKLYLNKNKRKEDGSCSIRIAVNHHGSSSYISLSQSVKPAEWDARTGKVKNRPDKNMLNDYLQNRLYHYNELLRKVMAAQDYRNNWSATELKNRIVALDTPEEEQVVLFSVWYHNFADRHGNTRTREIYETTWKRICEFDTDASSLTFEAVSREWLQRFDAFLAKTSPSVNARNIHLRNIRAVFNDALNEEVTTCYPFRRFKIRAVETAKRDLSVEQLHELWALQVEDWQQRYIDCFKLSFLLLGINIGDLLSLPADCIHNGRIEFNRKKTHRFYSILVLPEAMAIIDMYKGNEHLLCWGDNVSDYRYFMARCNRCLRKLGIVDGLTTYWARHTWATLAFKMGISKDTISLALGHSFGNRVTSVYINTDLSQVDEANRQLVDWLLK